jgi:hypothetical protein
VFYGTGQATTGYINQTGGVVILVGGGYATGDTGYYDNYPKRLEPWEIRQAQERKGEALRRAVHAWRDAVKSFPIETVYCALPLPPKRLLSAPRVKPWTMRASRSRRGHRPLRSCPGRKRRGLEPGFQAASRRG